MDWFSEWQPAPSLEIERVDRQRSWRRSFWCATVGRDTEVRFRFGCVVSCSAFEDPTSIACGRRCLDRSFRVQWPPALPVLPRPRATMLVF
jgi:hypothetical protein